MKVEIMIASKDKHSDLHVALMKQSRTDKRVVMYSKSQEIVMLQGVGHVEEAVYRYLLEKEDFGTITTSLFLTKFTKYAIQKKNIDGYLKFAIVNKRVKDAEKLLSLYCSYNPDILLKMKNYMDEDEEEEFASLQGYLRMRELHDVIQML